MLHVHHHIEKVIYKSLMFMFKQKQGAVIPVPTIRKSIKLPMGTDKNEWLAKNICEFSDELDKLYGTVTEYCTEESCPIMTAGPGFKYLWRENESERPEEVSAPEYIRRLSHWVKMQLDCEEIFPNEMGRPFPDNFEEIVKTLMRRMLRIYTHCYWHHQEHFRSLHTLHFLNISFSRFVWFAKEFDLIEMEQFEPVRNIVDKILDEDVDDYKWVYKECHTHWW